MPLRIGQSGIGTLKRTRPWALFVGIIAFVGAAANIFKLLQLLLAAPSSYLPASVPSSMAPFIFTEQLVASVVGVGIGCLFGWFALRYSHHLKTCMETMDPRRLEDALWWQKRYWTLQGGVVILCIVLAIVGMIAAFAVGISAAQYGGYPA